MQALSTPQEVNFETAACQTAQLDEAALSRALVSLAAGMEQIERALYSLVLQR